MGIKKPQFVNNEIYHIFNRGVEKREIFCNEEDYLRFIHNLFEFNDQAPAGKFSQGKSASPEIATPRVGRRKMVEILCFCLMSNHFHLILRQLVENGIVEFMKKLGIGYAMYFNQKYTRVGGLFQGRFKAILIENEDYLRHLFCYLHLNPAELVQPNWKKEGIKDWSKINEFLENYRWSSLPDYIGKKNFPSVTSRDFLTTLFDGPAGCKRYLSSIFTTKDLGIGKNIYLE